VRNFQIYRESSPQELSPANDGGKKEISSGGKEEEGLVKDESYYLKVWVWSDVIFSLYVYVYEYEYVYQNVSDVMYAFAYEYVYVYEGVIVKWCYLFFVCMCLPKNGEIALETPRTPLFTHS